MAARRWVKNASGEYVVEAVGESATSPETEKQMVADFLRDTGEVLDSKIISPEVTKPQYLYHASRRGDLYKVGIEPFVAGVIEKDPGGAKIFMTSDPQSAIGFVLSEERLKAERGIPVKTKGEIMVYRIKLSEGDYYRDPKSGDYVTKRAIAPKEIVGFKMRGQKFTNP